MQWTDDATRQLNVFRLFKGKHARLLRQRSAELVDAIFKTAIDCLMVSVAGATGQRVMLGEARELDGSDLEGARVEANAVFQSPAAITHLIDAAESEVEALVIEHRHLVQALAEELVIKRTMSNDEIDAVIARATEEYDAIRRSANGAALARMQARQRMYNRMRR